MKYGFITSRFIHKDRPSVSNGGSGRGRELRYKSYCYRCWLDISIFTKDIDVVGANLNETFRAIVFLFLV